MFTFGTNCIISDFTNGLLDEPLKSGKWVPIAIQSQYQPSGRTLHTSVVYKVMISSIWNFLMNC